jgi:hypothetical protein
MRFICHALGGFGGETQDETSLNVLVQFLHLLSQSVFHVSSAKFAKWLPPYSFDSPLETVVFSS